MQGQASSPTGAQVGRAPSVRANWKITVMGDSTLFWSSTKYTGRILQKAKNNGKQENIINGPFVVRRLHDKLLKKYYDVEESETLSRPGATVTQWLSMMDGLRKYKMPKPWGLLQ
jgi:hypothetical protein